MGRKAQISGRSEEILVVEDSPTQAEQLRHLLGTHSYRVEVASDGREAFDWLSSHKPSMVISDVLMPGIDGFELCKLIKTGKSTGDIPVILVTSLSNTEEVISGLTAGADSILTKPYNDEHLLSCVAKILDQYDKGEIVRETENVQINYGGRKRIIHTEPQKVINLLLDIYQGAIYQNEKLEQVKEELRRLNEHLETLVKDRTSDLSKEIEVNEEITARLRESEIKYRNIVETANEGIWKSNPDYRTTFVNEKLAQMFGYTSDEMIGRSVFDFMDEEEKDAAGNPETRNYRSGGSFEQTFRRKDGTRIIALVNVTSFVDSEGRYAGSIGLLTDITERKKVETALKESREKLNLALENGDIGTWEWNLNTNEIFCGQHFRKMFGLESRPALISIREFEKLIMDEDRIQVMTSITESIRNGDPCEISFRSKSPGGKVRHFNLKALVSEEFENKPVRVAGVCFDITKLQEDNEQILELNKKLMLSNRELERFAYVASHDLQEPLRMVSSYTQMLELRYADKLDPAARDYINFAVDGAHRMYNLINGLLAYSRIQRRGSTFKVIDLNKAVEDVKKMLEIQIIEKKAVIKADPLPLIQADESQIIQLLQNLVSNALKFSPRAPRIYITSKSEKDRYVISVRDEGIGIESQYFEKIFVIFQKLHSNDEYEGTGLGLAICKSIVEKHGGNIWVDSIPGKGSTFSFTLPLVRSLLPVAGAVNRSL